MDLIDSGIPVFALVMGIGLVGTVLPVLPGLALIWLTALLYGLLEGFGVGGWIAMIIITLLAGASLVAKVVLPKRRAEAGGAPTSTIVVGAIAGIIRFFTVPVVGLPLGGAVGVLLAEYRRTDGWPAAWRSTKGVIVGFGISALVELGIGMAMILTWLVWALAQA